MSLIGKGIIGKLLTGALLVVLGILVNSHAEYFLQIVLVAVAIGSLIEAVSSLIYVRRYQFKDATRTLSLIKAVELLIISIAALIFVISGASDTVLTVIVYSFAVGFVFSSVVSFQNATVSNMFNALDMTSHFIIRGVVDLIVAVLLFAKPLQTLNTVVKIVAICSIVIGATVFVFAIFQIVRVRKEKAEAVEVEIKE